MKKLPVFYTPKMVADSGAYSPSAGKPAAIMAAWKGEPIQVFAPAPATLEQLCLVHDPAYVKGVLGCTEHNGFGNRRADVAASLPYTSGAMFAAAKYALANRNSPAPCAPVSGFHHACYSGGGGYCTFNGLMVAAAALVAGGFASKVGILDADMHYGNGTDDIIRHLGAQGYIKHVTFGHDYRSPSQAQDFLARLPGVVAKMAARVDVIIYQAGADPHVNDPLGGWLTTDQLAARDYIVFETARKMRCPIAYDHAGGYQKEKDGSIPKVVQIHTNTLHMALLATETWTTEARAAAVV